MTEIPISLSIQTGDFCNGETCSFNWFNQIPGGSALTVQDDRSFEIVVTVKRVHVTT